jgi:large subunit ribosomal protein L21
VETIMYAVIRTGGKQYKVAKDDVITIERLAADKDGLVRFADVLLLGDGAKTTIGRPTVSGAVVAGAYLSDVRGDKLLVFKKKRRHNYRRKNGHRQDLSLVQIVDILTDGKAPDQKAIAAAIEAHRAKHAKVAAEAVEKSAKKTSAQKADAKKKAASKQTATKKEAAKKAEPAKPAKKAAAKTATKAKTAAKKTAAKKPPAKKKK